MLEQFKRNIVKMFREIIVYHNSSLEFRAKILTLMVSIDGTMNQCDQKLLVTIANDIYQSDVIRVNLLIDTVHEYFNKIIANNGLNMDDLILLVNREVRKNNRYTSKIDIDKLALFSACLEDEEDKIYHQRILDYLRDLKEEYGAL